MGATCAFSLRAVSTSPALYAASNSRSGPATKCEMTLTNPTAPTDSHGRFSGSSPE
ncbi:Uncharacterised protein [Mycobacteroides abscessus subsp. abscessus]|nr:Uncharacterised protein [Mycobacteroides abscessus subsp. abscessus]